MTRYSQNGWEVLTREETAVVRAAGVPFRVAPGTEPLWERFVTRFNAEVEPLAGPVLDDWSWADRNVRGSATVISNHASATALDLNATKHPRGVRDTFTDAQVKALRRLLADFPVIRWGGDFHTTVDDMHFELNADHAEVAAFIATLTTPEDDMPSAEEVAAAVWKYPIQRRETDAPNDTIPAGEAVSYATRFGYKGLENDKAEQGRDADVLGRLVSLEQGLNTLTELVRSLAAPPPAAPPAG